MVGRRQGRHEALLVALTSLAFALCFGYSILVRFFAEGLYQDWDYHLQLRWVPFYTLTHFHQFPLWNPYKCGGMPMLADPLSGFLTPFVLLDLIFGPVVGVHLQIIADIAAAFGGAYLLASVLGVSRVGAVGCAITFAGSSWFYLHLYPGHLEFFPYVYAPWVVTSLYLSSERNSLAFAALGGLVMALMLTEGSVYAFPQTGLMLAVLAAIAALQRRSVFPLLALVIILLFAFGFAAVKVLPSLEFVGLHVRPIRPDEVCPISLLLRALFARNQDPTFQPPAEPWRFWEFGAYVGVIFGCLALLAVVWRPRRALPWIILGSVFLALAAGDFGPYSPWVLQHRLPIFASHRVPTRWLILFTLVAGVLGGFGIDTIRAGLKKWGLAVAILLLALALIDDWSVSTRYIFHIFDTPQAPRQMSARFYQTSGNSRKMLVAARANTGSIACYESVGLRTYAVGSDQPSYRGEQYLLGPGTVTLTKWTPNQLSFDVLAPGPTVLIVNQNFDEGWHLISGKGEVFSRGGLIAVRLPAGGQHLEMIFRPRSFVVGLGITTLTFIVTLVAWLYERRRRPAERRAPPLTA
jgi:hypothetical protein